MTWTYEQIATWLGSYLWALFRIAAFVTSAPMFGSRTIPIRAKLGISIALTVLVVPLIPSVSSMDPFSAAGILTTINQIIIGVAMGLVFQLVFTMFIIGGQIIAYQMGLGFSQMVDPQSGTQVPVVGQFYIVIVTLAFFALNGHIAIIEIIIESFSLLPIGVETTSQTGLWQLVEWSKQMFVGGLTVALPAVAAILLVNFTFGVVTRSAPQFNIFSIGFPITIIMGFFVIMLTMTTVVPQFSQQLTAAIEVIRSMLGER